jgi:DNA-3-methyladenine glycosylase
MKTPRLAGFSAIHEQGRLNVMERSWLEQDPLLVAELLIGCHLVRRTEQGVIRVRINETEAYKGGEDPASHAYRGMTPRTKVMFGEVGHLYVYFVYGMYYCMNVVAHLPGAVGAVLLRGATPVEGIELVRDNRPGVPDKALLNGPAKLTQGLGVTKEFYGHDLIEDSGGLLSLQDRDNVEPPVIRRTPRIGISAGQELHWRFVAEG